MKEATVPFVRQYAESLPAAYPADLEEEILLPSGEALWIRPVVPGDAPILASEFSAADDDTLHARFFTASFDLTHERLRYLTELDYTTHLALAVMTAAGDRSEGVAIGRYAARTATDVEGAIVVKRRFRCRGIAGVLMDRLASAADRAGYITMSASYLADNAAAAGLLAGLGFTGGALHDGVVVDASRRLTNDPAPVGIV
jgi:GNAT superfamily N-acetyltransferase